MASNDLVSVTIVTLMRLGLVPYKAWRVPLSVNFIDVLLAFGGAAAAIPLLDGAMVLTARLVDAARAIRGRLR